MPDFYTLTAVWRKTFGELSTSTPRDPRTLEEYVDALAKVVSPLEPPAVRLACAPHP